MEKFNLKQYKHIHFIGVGGISMYLLAIYCKESGFKVSGSDIRASKYTEICKQNGIKVHISHKRKNVHGADLIVYTSAVNDSNVEIIEARKRQIQCIERADLLAEICKQFKCVIGIAGTHGKTTTSAMIYHILRESGKKVSCHIGADINNAQLNPNDEFLVLECCEYNRSFLHFNCDVGVVLNIDNDHLDCYQNMYNLQNAFKMFLKHSKNRFVFDSPSTKCIKNRVTRIKSGEIIDVNKFIFDEKKYVLDNVFGKHNINNAMVAVAVCLSLGVSYVKIQKALKTFVGAGRRCEILGKIKGCDVITDYAHHPTEIENVYNALIEKYSNVYIVFQPHTYSRTKILLHEFVKLFSGMENLTIFKEYSARENSNRGLSAKQLCEYLDNAKYVKSYGEIKKWVIDYQFNQDDCIVFVGAGDINKVAERTVRDLGIKV